ncbi:hypothetical protein T484DRAFT_1779631 [Baffinella frigidus]|nr:hypothetical protein T484DRAFT_1779631 [Cryptophyta sp. CCMP2293]
MARGLLGGNNEPRLQFRHERGKALKNADLTSSPRPDTPLWQQAKPPWDEMEQVILFGAVCDFRLQYGNSVSQKATLVVVNKCQARARQNRAPTLAVKADAATFLVQLSAAARAGMKGKAGAVAEGQAAVGWFGETCAGAGEWMQALNAAEEHRVGWFGETCAGAGEWMQALNVAQEHRGLGCRA